MVLKLNCLRIVEKVSKNGGELYVYFTKKIMSSANLINHYNENSKQCREQA